MNDEMKMTGGDVDTIREHGKFLEELRDPDWQGNAGATHIAAWRSERPEDEGLVYRIMRDDSNVFVTGREIPELFQQLAEARVALGQAVTA